MTNPFINDDRLMKMKNAGANYCVVSPESSTSVDFMGFMDRSKAYKNAVEASDSGLWAYVIELTDFHVIAYLTGYCTNR